MRVDDHTVGTISLTCRGEVTAALNFYYADTASAWFASIVELVKVHVAESRDFDTQLSCSIENGNAIFNLNDSIINCNFHCFNV